MIIDLRNLVRNKLYICRDWHIQPSEIDKMAYYEYEWILEDIKAENKRQEEEHKKPEEEHKNMMQTPRMPKMPSMPSMPKLSIPKL